MSATMPPRLVTRALLGLVLAAGLAACATNPVTGKREFVMMSESEEIAIGQQLDAEVRREMGVYQDEELQRYVEEIGLRLARASERPDLPWTFAIVDVPAINAFALPGGYIYLTRGIMPYLGSEAELAGVLGHEIGHVTARHAVQQYTKASGAGLGLTILSIFVPASRPFGGLAETGLGLLFLKYGRDDELQADRLGAAYTARSGWDPSGVAGMLTTLSRIEEVSDRRGIPNWLATHPNPGDRVEELGPTLAELQKGEQPFTSDRNGYLRRIDGMVYGDNPEEGVVRGSDFLHPALRFALEFPEGWDITNGKTQVVGQQPGDDVYLILQMVDEPRGRSLDEIAERSMRQAGLRRVSGAPADVNGLNAYIGTYEGSMQGLGQVTSRAAHIVNGRTTYVFAGLAKRDLFSRAERDFDRSLRSFRPLSRGEADEIRPNRIDLYTVQAGDSWQSIAQREGGGIIKPTTLAIMNNFPVQEQPRPGDRIKIAVAG